MSWEFLLTAFIIVATPGTGAIYTLAAGLSHGPRAGILAALASTLGIIPHVMAAITGLAAVLHTSALAFDLIKYAGVLYLLYMAWGMYRDTGTMRIRADAQRRTVSGVFMDGIALNLLNPKLSIFFVAFLPQFIKPAEPDPLFRMLILSLVFMGMTFLVFAVYGAIAGKMREQVLERPSVLAAIRNSFAAAFGALAVKLAITER